VSSNSDCTADKFREVQKRIEGSLEAIKPTEEYKDFTEKTQVSLKLPKLSLKVN
jgi:hypothetical protein